MYKKNIFLKKVESPPFGELSKILKTTKEEITLALESQLPVSSIEENSYQDNKTGSNINILDTVSTNKDEATLIVNKITINKMINKLSLRDKQLMLLRYYKDQTQSDVAKILGISQVQVSRIEKKILSQMKEELVQ